MNIGLFTDTYFPQINGVGTSTNTLYNDLTKKGHNVYIFTTTDPKAAPNENENIERMPSMPFIFVRQYRMGLLYSPAEIRKIAKLKLDIVHTQTEFSLGMFGLIFSKTLNIPMVHTYHTMYEDYVHYIINGHLISPDMAKYFSKKFCNAANAIVAPTGKVKDSLETYGVTRPIKIIPTGIKIEHFKKRNFSDEEINNIKTELGLKEARPVILSLGRVAKEKSIDTVIKAMPKILERIPDVKLVIVGDGPVRNELETLTYKLNINNSVIFAGAKPWGEIGKYYQLGDVYVSASVTETQGLTFIEAMAAQIPVVAKKDKSIDNVVTDNVTGVLFEDDNELHEKIYEILINNKKRMKIIQNSTKFAETLSANSFGSNIENLYMDLLENPSSYGYKKRSLSPLTLGKRVKDKFGILNISLHGEKADNEDTLAEKAKPFVNPIKNLFKK